MQYSIEIVTKTSLSEMIGFLKEHEDYTLFLLNNLENYGLTLTEAPFSGNFKLIRSGGRVVGVFCLTRTGTLLLETTLREPIFNTVLDACHRESIPLTGIIGNWDFCRPFWEYLKAEKMFRKEIRTSKQNLYKVDLSKHDFSHQHHVRHLTEIDYIQWKPLRLANFIEEGMPNHLTDQQLFDQFLEKAEKKISWGFFVNNRLMSMAELNAKAFDLGQVGGVYTAPEFRQKGYSKSVMKQLLLDCQTLHKLRKMIIFTDEKNIPAQKLYTSLGVSQVGHFALLFFD